jgi:hypothetical protein
MDFTGEGPRANCWCVVKNYAGLFFDRPELEWPTLQV